MHRQPIPPSLQRLWRDIRGSVSYLIVTACTVVFVVLTVLDLCHLVSRQRLLAVLGVSYVGVVQHGWLFQFLTAPLLHVNLTHLAFNMLTLWMLGPDVEATLGRRRYVLFSLLCAICALAGFLLTTPGRRAIGFGYSGVIFGLLVAQATFFPHRVVYIYAFFPLKMTHAALLLGAVELYFLVSSGRSSMAHSAHLSGALGAWVYLRGTRWWAARYRARRQPAKQWYRRMFAPTPLRRSLFRLRSQHDVPAVVQGAPAPPICMQCGATLPTRRDRFCARCAAQHTQPPVRPSIRGHRAPAPALTAWLEILAGPLAGRRVALSTQPLTLGRAPGNGVVIATDREISRFHATLVPNEQGHYTIVDNNSRNGVFVNGTRTGRHLLQPGDHIRLGTTEMTFAASRR